MLDIGDKKPVDWDKIVKQPLVVHENANVLRVMEQLRNSPVQIAVVVDEHGSFEGVVTPTDVLEAIAGEFPDEDEEAAVAQSDGQGGYLVDGFTDIRRLSGLLERDLLDDGDRYTTLAGYVLWHLGHLPLGGESFVADGTEFKIESMNGRHIGKVRIVPSSDYEV